MIQAIEKKRLELKKIIEDQVPLELIGAIKKQIVRFADIYKEIGVLALSRQLHVLRMDQARRDTYASALARDCYFIVARMRRIKHQNRQIIREQGIVLQDLYARFFDLLVVHDLIPLLDPLLDEIQKHLEQNQQDYLMEDPDDIAHIVKIENLYEKIAIASLFSTRALISVYAAEIRKHNPYRNLR